MQRLQCIACSNHFPIDEVRYTCDCGNLLSVERDTPLPERSLFDSRRANPRTQADQSGVWRFREALLDIDEASIVTHPEGATRLYERHGIWFKHEGENPTGSFKDRGMTVALTQAVRLGARAVACASTGNTSASLAAYAAQAGLQAIVFVPSGKISAGKLAQTLAYGARCLQVRGDFDTAMRLVREACDRLGIYLLNSINPFRIEGQKTIMVEMMDQRDWCVPDWVVLPGGNLGNTSAFGKALREMRDLGLIPRLPRIAVIQAEGSAPFYNLLRATDRSRLIPVEHPQTLATAIRIGDPVSWPKALHEVTCSGGVVEKVTEQEIADAKAIIGRCGIGCEPASAATLAGIQKLTTAGTIARDADVVAVLTGNVLKDPDYIYRYHTGALEAPDGTRIMPNFGNSPTVVPNDADRIAELLSN